jgi:hypothetical protein
VVLLEGEVPAETIEVVFESPEAVGVDSNLLCSGALPRSSFLEFCETLFVLEDPLGILELHLKAVFLFTISVRITEEVVMHFTWLLNRLGQVLQPLYNVTTLY